MDEPNGTVRTRAHSDGAVVVTVEGHLDHTTTPAFTEALHGAAERSRRVRVDLSAIEGIDHAGVGALDAGRRALRTDFCELSITNPSERALQVLQMSGLGAGFDGTGEAADTWAGTPQERGAA